MQQFVTSYNATPHRPLNKILPKDVNDSNKAALFGYMYPTQKTHKHSSKIHKGNISYKLKIGSLVRILHLNSPLLDHTKSNGQLQFSKYETDLYVKVSRNIN